MPINIEQISNQVNVVDSDLPFDERQLERIVDLVVQRLQERQRSARWNREATSLRKSAVPEEGSCSCLL
jgi:hypothetical protein